MVARRSSAFVVAVLVSAAVGAVPAGHGAPAKAQAIDPGMTGEIAFATFRNGDFEIYAMAADGSGQRNLTRSPRSADLDPAWSPDGARIAFSRYLPGNPTAEVFVMNADGGGKVRLTRDHARANDREPVWNPAGTRIAFTRTVPVKGTSRIVVMRADGTRRRSLTRTARPAYDSSPAWSPTGGRIAFASDRAGGFPEIWVMNGDGTEPVRLTSNGRIEANPAWSPDGTRIAFERCCPDGNSDIWVMNADGTEKARVTATPANETEPTWSPDGSTIAFGVFPPGGGNRDVHAVTLDGGLERVLADGETADVAPDWQGPAAILPPEPGASPEPSDTAAPSPSPSPSPSPPPSPEDGSSPTVSPTPETTPPSSEPTSESPTPGGGATTGTLHGSVATSVLRPASRPRYRTLESRRLLPGLRYRKILDRRGPNRIYVLRMNPVRRPTLDLALAGGVLPGFARTSRMASSHRAVAAVNGDFSLPGGRPAHPFAEDGFLHQTSFAYSHNVAVSHGEDAAYFRHPTARLSMLQRSSGDALRIDRWNQGEPTWGEVGAYTPSGGMLEPPPAYACSARLQPAGPRRWAPEEVGISRDYVVDRAACRRLRLPRKGGVVVAAQPGSPEALLIRSLVPGETVTLTWSFGWAGVADTIGGYPLLLKDGQTVVTDCRVSICGRHPRTAIGVDGDGRLLLVVVDGRRRRSVGLKIVQLAKLMRRLGAVSALNLDGGGSSTMVVRGRIVNRPSDGRERWVSSAVLVLDGVDPGERIEGAAPLFTASPAAGAGAGEERAVPARAGAPAGSLAEVPAILDPASTGGMLDAVDRGLFGSKGWLSPDLRSLLRGFRASGWS